MTPAIFLDRDGTLCRWVHHLNRLGDIYVYKKAVVALKMLQRQSEFKFILVSNQAAVAKGKMSEKKAWKIHHEIMSPFKNQGIHFTDEYLCFDHLEGSVKKYQKDSDYRKPSIGFARLAEKKHGICLHHSYMIGDNITDIEFGLAFGGRPILVKTGLGKNYVEKTKDLAEYIAGDLLQAAKYILSQ